MSFDFYDVGVTTEHVLAALAKSPVVSVVGYENSGKSTLGEKLRKELTQWYESVYLQDASTWLLPHGTQARSHMASEASVDSEVVAFLERSGQSTGHGCWILDNAEVMLAHATTGMLDGVARRLRSRRISLILIRNRFVLEGEGWLAHRLSMLAASAPALYMRPLQESDAVAFATTVVRNRGQSLQPWVIAAQGGWLGRMSGGIPGLVSELRPYAPLYPDEEPRAGFAQALQRKREQLQLHAPLRTILVAALADGVLPPLDFLTEEARRELGVLMVAGMVAPDYAVQARPFRGSFWERLSGREVSSRIADRHIEAALQLVLVIGNGELADLLVSTGAMENDRETALANALAQAVACREFYPFLAQPLEGFLSENIGRLGLLRMLAGSSHETGIDAPLSELAHRVLERAGA